MQRGRKAKVIDPSEVDDDAFVLSIAGVGAPPVLIEHLVSEKLLLRLLARAEAFYGRRVDVLISAEIGGANSMFPLALSAISGVPVVDADGVGRAIPHIEMTTFSIFGVKATPGIVMDELGNVFTLETANDHTAEDAIRAVTGTLGAMTYCALYPMSGKQMKASAVLGTIDQTLQIGRVIRQGRERSEDLFGDLLAYLGRDGRLATILFDGKIVDVTHEMRDGWHWGRATMSPLGDGPDVFTIDFQNEFTVARLNGKTVTIVPDLISVLDRETGEPLTGRKLAYGQRVKVLGYAADPLLRLPESLDVLGSRMFGMDEDYVPIEQLNPVRQPEAQPA